MPRLLAHTFYGNALECYRELGYAHAICSEQGGQISRALVKALCYMASKRYLLNNLSHFVVRSYLACLSVAGEGDVGE